MKNKAFSEAFGFARVLLWAVLFALVVKTTVAEGYHIPTSSMENTLLTGDFIVANKFLYGARIPFTSYRLPAVRPPRPGDIITFKWPGDRKTDYVKRCVAIAGQTVEVRNKVLYVDNVALADPEQSKHTDRRVIPRGKNGRDNFGPYLVPEGSVFAMGDNRDNSYDSRFWGPVPLELIEGKVFLIQWSIAPDEKAPQIDLTDMTSIPVTVFHTVTHFLQRFRWERSLNLVG